MKRKTEPTEFDIKVLRALSDAFGGRLEQSEYPRKTYFLVDADDTRLGMYTVAEVTRWWKAGWIICRQDGATRPKDAGEYILTDAGSEIIESALRPPEPPASLLEYRYEN